MLATQLGLIVALATILYLVRQVRSAKWIAKTAHDLLGQHNERTTQLAGRVHDIDRQQGALNEGHHELFRLLKTSVSVDVGGRYDCGWLIFIARVNGQDMVKIQHLKPEMTMEEYRHLVEKLHWDCQHVAYLDGPRHVEEFLRPRGGKRGARW